MAELVFVRIVDPLDEPRGYCIDISGYDDHINIDNPLQAHTCKEEVSNGDMVFDSARLLNERDLFVPVYDYCAEAADEAGAHVFIKHCTAGPSQKWALSGNGTITPVSNSGLCLTLGTETAEAGTPPDVQQYCIEI